MAATTFGPAGDPSRVWINTAPFEGFKHYINQRLFTLIDRARRNDWKRVNGPHASAFCPYHEFSVVYPALALLRPKRLVDGVSVTNEIIREIVPDCSSEYNPLDRLIEDDAVAVNAGRDTVAANGFESRSRAYDTIAANPQIITNGVPTASFETMITTCQDIPGSTKISVTTYTLATDPAGILRATVRVETTVRGPQGSGTAAHVFEYDNALAGPSVHPLEDLISDRMRASHKWSRDLYDLLYGNTRRAMKHRLLNYDNAWRTMNDYDAMKDPTRWQIEDRMRDDYRFRPKRQPDYYSLLGNLVTVPTLAMIAAKDAEDRSCIICGDDFNQGPNNALPMNAVILPCPGSHLCCRGCIMGICEAMGPEKACCPTCGSLGRLFNADQVKLLKYNVDSNEDFRVDVRFQQWEEVQRSFADLDKYLTDSDELHTDGISEIRNWDATFIYRLPDMFMDIWADMIEADALYPEHEDHNPILFPEFELVVRTVARSLLENQGAGSTIKKFYTWLKREIDDEFLRQLVSKGGDIPFLGTTLVQQAAAGSEAARNTIGLYRPGLEEFVKRSLNRTLQFFRLRLCYCGVSDHARIPSMGQAALLANRKHSHGGRLFYNHNVYEWIQFLLYPQS